MTINQIEFKEKLEKFLYGAQHIVDENYKGSVLQYKLVAREGKKFIKVCSEQIGSRGSSAWCFIDKTNGDVLKAASWAAPAKHARGNIFDSSNGLASVGPYGPAYLR
jgi:hypothetical protein